MKSWQELQLLSRKLNALSNSVVTKESEFKAKYKSALEEYHKQKYSQLFYRENNKRYLGFAGRETPKPRKKIQIVSGELIIGYHKINKYLYSIRNELALQLALIGSLKKGEETIVAKIFVNCFFDNPSSTIHEFLIKLIQELIAKEVLINPCPYVISFISLDTFIGKLIGELVRTSEIVEYASFAFKDIINNLDLNELSKMKFVFEEEQTQKKGEVVDSRGFEILDVNELRNEYNQSKTNKHLMAKHSASMIDNSSLLCHNTTASGSGSISTYRHESMSQSFFQPKSSNQKPKPKPLIKEQSNAPHNNSQIIRDYYEKIQLNSITEKKMRLKHLKETNTTTKEYFFDTLLIMANSPDIYSTNALTNLFMKASEQSIEQFIQTLQTIIDLVIKIVGKLSYANCVPEVIRLVGRIIFSEAKKANPNASHYRILSYVGKFFYEKCLSPLVYIPEIYGVEMDNKILSINTRAIIVAVNLVLSQLFSFELFTASLSPLYTPLNHHFIEWLPLVIEILESLIQDSPEDAFDHSIKMAHFESFCISIPDISFLIDKSLFLSPNEKENKDLFEIKKLILEEGEDVRFLFITDEMNLPETNQYEISKSKGKLLEHSDEHNYCEEISYSIFQLFLNLPLAITSGNMDLLALSQAINQKLQFYSDRNEISTANSLPLSWFSNYITSHLHQMPIEYRSDNYQGLYDKIYFAINSMYEALQSRDSVLTYDFTYELNAVLAKTQKVILQKTKMKALLIDIFRTNFIEITPICICFMSGFDIIQFEKAINYSFDSFDPNSLLLHPQDCCIHMKLRTKLKISYHENELALKNVCHFNYIQGFINKFKQYSLFCEDDISNTQSGETFDLNDISKNKKTNDILFNYIDIIKRELTSSVLLPFYDLKSQEKVINDLKEEIQEYILQKIWDPNNTPVYLEECNQALYSTCLKLSWIDPVKHLRIKRESISSHHIQIATDFLKKIDSAKSPGSIIKWFDKATDVIMKTFLFTANKSDIGADDINPIYLYLMIQIQPKKMISQFSFCKLFTSQKNLLGRNGYILTTLEWVIGCIKEINHETLNIDKAEFDRKCQETKMHFISENLKLIN